MHVKQLGEVAVETLPNPSPWEAAPSLLNIYTSAFKQQMGGGEGILVAEVMVSSFDRQVTSQVMLHFDLFVWYT